MKKLVVNKKYNGKKLNTFLLHSVDGLTYSLFANTLRKKDIKINGKRVNKDVIVYNGDEVLLYISDEVLVNKAKNNNFITDISVVYEDSYILVLNKPQGIEVTGDNSLTAHLAHICLPIIGDSKYGVNSVNKQFQQKMQCLMIMDLLLIL